ncbi:MAG: DoxX family protein [Crocinitomicaceae bacterium]|nr:DoxX family protein [Crocinitomicaceae bacterium]
MKRLFNYQNRPELLNIGILLSRVAGGAFMLTHGMPKLEKLMAGGDIQFADPMGIGMHASLLLAVLTEVVCALLLIFGLGTRLALVGLIATMAVAAFVFHGADPFAGKEKALLYLVLYGFLFFTGSGKYSLDYLIHRKMK